MFLFSFWGEDHLLNLCSYGVYSQGYFVVKKMERHIYVLKHSGIQTM